ncbi:MAG: hypothetical protein AAB425_01210, partial [Bdellovibrionota bacterium]
TISKVGIGGNSLIDGNNGGYDEVGGIVGALYKPGTIDQAYAGSSVTVRSAGGGSIGGIAGSAYGTAVTAGNSVTISNSYSGAFIYGDIDRFGGIVGDSNYALIKNNYFTGIANDTNGNGYERGIVGTAWANMTLTDNYYDSTVCASASSYCSSTALTGVTAYTTAQMKDSANFPGGWDFTTIWLAPGAAYFKLRWEP